MQRIAGRFFILAVFLIGVRLLGQCSRGYEDRQEYVTEKQEAQTPVVDQDRTYKPQEIRQMERLGYRFVWDTDIKGFDGAWIAYSIKEGWMLTYFPETDGISLLLDLSVSESNFEAAAMAHWDFLEEFGINQDWIVSIGDEVIDDYDGYSGASSLSCRYNYCCEATLEEDILVWTCVSD